MKYKMINEKLQIASIKLEELTINQACEILNQWETGARLDTLTMFFDRRDGVLILNASNEHYADYLKIASGYLYGNAEERMEIRKNAPESLHETMDLLEECFQYREYTRMEFQAMNNRMNKFQRKYVDMLIGRHGITAAYIAFMSGVISGKRAERRKRKGVK